MKIVITIGLMLLTRVASVAQHPSVVRVYDTTLTTYPFSQPDPVPNLTNLYPYFRYDGFTDHPVEKKWKIVELDNEFIKVYIIPQIGGKIWTAIDKKNGKPFIYNNDAVKFRDVAMRGPWTSGGIEINYGMFGHTPGVATPVNYVTRKNPDGSVSCILSLLDLLTETRWSVEVRLPRDKAYFITKSVWHNGTGIYQPYYAWMNLGEKVSDSLEYIYPGTNHIFHDGKVYPWPIDKKNGKNISIYAQNDFGGAKSYHVIGAYTMYYGAFWQKENFGMIHYAPERDKIGKKIWIWGLSGAGMIWEKILTDHAGQYTEIQSGRLYNQNAPASVFTPFKQFFFMPYNTDTWSEYWYPFQNTDSVTYADLNGVFNVKKFKGSDSVLISPASYINDILKIINRSGTIIFEERVKLKPLESFRQRIPLKNGEQIGKIFLAGSEINLVDSTDKVLDRPVEPDSGFNWESAYGLYLRGRYNAGTRHYEEAESFIDSSLEKQPYFMPALSLMSYLQYRRMNYDSAFYYAKKALSIDTYDPASNYYYGLAAWKLNKWYDAMDGFQVAAITPEFRSAAYTEMSELQIIKHHYKSAYQLATESLINNTENITGLQLQYLAMEHLGKTDELQKIRQQILTLDPLNNFIRFETYWQNRSESNKHDLTRLIRDELPGQTYLHLADWYLQLGLNTKAEAVLQLAPEKNDEMLYWLAFLHKNNNKEDKQWLEAADAGNPAFVFPFRKESYYVMQWASQHTDNWKPKYYLALLENYFGNKSKELQLLEKAAPASGFAPLYVTMGRLCDSSDISNILHDYKTAASLDKADWRYGKYLAEFLLNQGQSTQALQVIEPYFKKAPRNYIMGMLYVRCLMANNQYKQAENILSRLDILPFEGARDGHLLYQKIKLMLALQLLQKKQYNAALLKISESEEWPEHLGEGKPYPNMINDSLQTEIETLIKKAKKSHRMPSKEISRYQAELNKV